MFGLFLIQFMLANLSQTAIVIFITISVMKIINKF